MHTSPLDQPGTKDAGGMNVAVLSSARELANLGVEVDLITRSDGAASSIQIADRLWLHELRAGAYGPIAKEELPGVTEAFGNSVRDLITRSGRNYDLIHAHYWLSGLATLPIAREAQLPFIQTFHTLAALKELKNADDPSLVSQRHRVETELAAQADAVIAVSSAEVTAMNETATRSGDRIWIVPHGVDTELFNPARRANSEAVRSELNIGNSRLLLVVGRVQEHKSQHLAIRALAELAASSAEIPALAIVGEPTPGAESYYWELVDLASELGLTRKVKFVGALEREPLANYLAAADLTLLPSRSETFGLVALESASSGTPVVAFAGSGMRESVSEGVSGLLVASREPVDWARTIGELLRNADGLAELSERARNFALNYSWSESARSLMMVYQEVLRHRENANRADEN